MASIWDFLYSLPKRSDVTPEELARRRQGYADLYQGGLLAGNRDQIPLSVQGAQATQDFLPVIGDALALGEAGEAFSRGELAAAGLLGAGAAIGLVPAAGDALAKPVMAAGRRAADIARRVEVNPNAFGSMGGNIRLRPEDVTPAQEVAGLLSSGRAADVTDEMLAKLTPKDEMELFELYQRGATGMDLPMDEASRMARAAEIGRSNRGLHGTVTGNDFTAFRDDRETYIAPVSQEGLDLVAQFSSADQGRVLPLMYTDDILDTTDPSGMFQSRRDFQSFYDENNLGDFMAGDKGLPHWSDMQAIQAGKDAGYGGIKLEERDWVDSTAVYDPSNIRSRFARFDPRLAHLRNLSAGVGGLGLLSSIMPQEEQY